MEKGNLETKTEDCKRFENMNLKYNRVQILLDKWFPRFPTFFCKEMQKAAKSCKFRYPY